MVDESLLEYVRAMLATGASREVIVAQLETGGWTAQDAVEAFTALESVPVAKHIPAPEPEPVSVPEIQPQPAAPLFVASSAPASASEPLPQPFIPSTPQMQTMPAPVLPANSRALVVPMIALAVVVLLAGASAYAYLREVGPFAPMVYTLGSATTAPSAASTTPGR